MINIFSCKNFKYSSNMDDVYLRKYTELMSNLIRFNKIETFDTLLSVVWLYVCVKNSSAMYLTVNGDLAKKENSTIITCFQNSC